VALFVENVQVRTCFTFTITKLSISGNFSS
jgi:hypothetical protein